MREDHIWVTSTACYNRNANQLVTKAISTAKSHTQIASRSVHLNAGRVFGCLSGGGSFFVLLAHETYRLFLKARQCTQMQIS